MKHALCLTLCALFVPFASPHASAQVDLPSKSSKSSPGRSKPARKQTGNIAPHLVCGICFERNYTVAIDFGTKDGMQNAHCLVCQKKTQHLVPKASSGSAGGLGLPSGKGEQGAPNSNAPTTTPRAVGQGGSVRSDAAQIVMREVARLRVKEIDARVAIHAVENLLALGDSGTVAARMALGSDHAPTVMTGIRVLLRTGVAADADLVVARIQRRLPRECAADALKELIARDPVRSGPGTLAPLLEHVQGPVRTIAYRELERNLGPDMLDHLARVLHARASDSRLKALTLISRIDAPERVDLLLSRIADPKATVAWRAVSTLSKLPDERIDADLLAEAFSERWILRRNAYALLAIVEREDFALRGILNENHIEVLLSGLSSSDPLVSGSCAAALAGIAFRSDSLAESEWLNHFVPDRLISTVTGREFFNDFSSLEAPALRRLQQIAGVTFGSDGGAWVEWWIENRATFSATRAVIRLQPGDEPTMTLHVHDASRSGGTFTLLGPAHATGDVSTRPGENFFLTEEETIGLIELIRREGMLGVERLPGVRGGGLGFTGRALDLRVGGQSKVFVLGLGVEGPWFERAMNMAFALQERNRWQRFPQPGKHESREALWHAESSWWQINDDPAVRAARLTSLVMGYMAEQLPVDREAGIAELERIIKSGYPPQANHFQALLDMLAEEGFFARRAERLVALTTRAAGLQFDGEAADSEEVRIRAWQIIEDLHKSFGPDAAIMIAQLVVACGDSGVRIAARDGRPLLRSVAAGLLSRSMADGDYELLEQLMKDPVEDVEIAAVLALGEQKIELARDDLLYRSRLGTPGVRSAALRAIGLLGGEGTLDALTVALADATPQIKMAAAEGLADLADPTTAGLLVAYLRQGRGSPAFAGVREGLLRLGEAAHYDLMISMRSPNPAARREAALLLSEQGVPTAASALMRVLSDRPDDNAVANELTVLTCIDFRNEPDPSRRWWSWWDDVKHGDSLSWFRAALQQRGEITPEAEDFTGEVTLPVIAFLIDVMRGKEAFLVTRAMRELEALLGRSVGELPPYGQAREQFLASLFETLQRQ